MSKNNLRGITLVREPIWGIHSLTLIISCPSSLIRNHVEASALLPINLKHSHFSFCRNIPENVRLGIDHTGTPYHASDLTSQMTVPKFAVCRSEPTLTALISCVTVPKFAISQSEVVSTVLIFIPNRNLSLRFGGIPAGEFGRAMVRILARRIVEPNYP